MNTPETREPRSRTIDRGNYRDTETNSEPKSTARPADLEASGSAVSAVAVEEVDWFKLGNRKIQERERKQSQHGKAKQAPKGMVKADR